MIEQDNNLGPRRTGKSLVSEAWAAAQARAGHRVVILRPGSHTVILPFERPTPDAEPEIPLARPRLLPSL